MDRTWWVGLGFSLAALAMGYGLWPDEDELTDEELLEDPLARRPDPLIRSLKRFWSRAFWDNPISLLLVAVVTTPLGGFFIGPFLGGRAAVILSRRAGYRHSMRLGVAVGVAWFVVFLLVLIAWREVAQPLI